MTTPKGLVRSLRLAAMIQMTLIFVAWLIFTNRIFTLASGLREALHRSGVPTEDVDRINQVFSSITYDLVWMLLAGVVATCLGFGLLIRLAKKWYRPF